MMTPSEVRMVRSLFERSASIATEKVSCRSIMSEVEKLCDVIGIVQNGKLLAEGTLAQLRQKSGEQDLEEIFLKVVAPHYTPPEEH